MLVIFFILSLIPSLSYIFPFVLSSIPSFYSSSKSFCNNEKSLNLFFLFFLLLFFHFSFHSFTFLSFILSFTYSFILPFLFLSPFLSIFLSQRNANINVFTLSFPFLRLSCTRWATGQLRSSWAPLPSRQPQASRPALPFTLRLYWRVLAPPPRFTRGEVACWKKTLSPLEASTLGLWSLISG